jgi:putative nucleotidyltransferase with HDIG domain
VEPASSRESPLAGRVLTVGASLKTFEMLERALTPPDFLLLPPQASEKSKHRSEAERRHEFAAPPSDVILLDCLNDSRHLVNFVAEMTQDTGTGEIAPAILVLTGPGSSNDALHAIRMGAYDALTAPFSDGQLQAAVRRAVEYRRLRVQNDLYRCHFDQVLHTRTRMIENTLRQLEQSYDVTLEALGNALDLKDAETEGHSKRVTAYTLALGRVLGLAEAEMRTVGRGAFLHDIGKMAIPDAILRKPGALSAEERKIMRTHCELGYRMLLKIPYLQDAAEIVYAHQECFDGSGYPRSLRGEQIPIGARIFALADMLDAVTSNRPYRPASTIEQARSEALRCSGSQFDPTIVDVFLATPDSIWQDLRAGIMRDGAEFSPFRYTFGPVA